MSFIEWASKFEVDPEQEKVCKDAAEERRRTALDLAHRYGNFDSPVEKVIDDAIAIEAYLRGELDSPDKIEIKGVEVCMCPESVECGECRGVVRP